VAGFACTDDGNACTDDVCPAGGGACTHPNDNTNTCGSSSDTDCDNPDTCSAGQCLSNNEAAGFACTDDGNACTDDVCPAGGGACTHPNDNTNTCGSNSDTDCDNPDTCVDGVCQTNNEAAGFACTDDGNACTDDVCPAGGGACTHPNDNTNTCGSNSDTDCDNPDTCVDGVCQTNNEAAGSACTDDGNACTDDVCPAGGGACTHPNDNTNTCGSSSDTDCDNPDTCVDGVCQTNNEAAGFACTDDGNACTDDECDGEGICVSTNDDTNTCGSPDDTECDNPNTCLAGECLENHVVDETACGDAVCDWCVDGVCVPVDSIQGPGCTDDTDNDCTDKDICVSGECDRGNTACSFVTNSSLCSFDEYNQVGTCSITGGCCLIGGDGSDCVGGTCEQSDQFRLVFTPDVQVWPGYKLSSSNPGQTYYNLIVLAQPSETSVDISVPYPYVTVGAMPVHVYCAEDLDFDDNGCFAPPTAEAAHPLLITMSDWINATNHCEAAGPTPSDPAYPKDAGTCTITVPLPPAGQCNNDKYYINVHLDYGLKGVSTDGTDEGTAADRYDAMNPSNWGTYDAYVNVLPGSTPDTVAINDCTPYTFSDGGSGQFDTVYSANAFKRIAGVFNQTTTSVDGAKTGVPGVTATLTNKATGAVVAAAAGDADGYIQLPYKHTGKAATFTVTLDIPGVGMKSKDVQLKANGWAEASYDVTTGTWYVQSVGTK
jgi:hypothetical protein